MAPEHDIQKEIVEWLRTVLPQAVVHAARNEMPVRGPKGARQLAKAKKAGMTPGYPDLIVHNFATAGVVLFEVKTPEGSLSSAQKECHAALRELGYPVGVVRSIEDVRHCLRAWNIGFSERAI